MNEKKNLIFSLGCNFLSIFQLQHGNPFFPRNLNNLHNFYKELILILCSLIHK